MDQVGTPFVFLSDIDFLPGPGSYSSYKHYSRYLALSSKSALVVPAFETKAYKFQVPETKLDLLSRLKKKEVMLFHGDKYSRGHRATNYYSWILATKPYQVRRQFLFQHYCARLFHSFNLLHLF